MKKLIPAIAMTLVAAAMFATSTFAWFSMNTQVQATGMQVKATTPESVEISQDHSTWAFTTNFTTDAEVLDPTYYYTDSANASNSGFYIPTATNKIQANGAPTTAFSATDNTNWKKLTLDANGKADSKNYLATYTLYLRTNVGTEAPSSGTTPTPVKLTCKAELGGNSKLKNSVKVGFMADDGTVTEITSIDSGEWTAALSTASPAYTTIKVVIWYDGSATTDGGAYIVQNSNADLTATTITLTFDKKTTA